MNDYNNKHLNIFHHYHQKGSIPIENNISRGLAIVLQEYPSLFLLLLDRIKEQDQNIPSLSEEYTVFFQKRISQFESFKNIVGVSLTAAKGLEPLVENGEAEESKKDPITDIAIEYGETVIIIEVKRTEENCKKQLKEQIDQLKRQINEKYDITVEEVSADLTWTDIIILLEQYIVIVPKVDRLLQDYYKHICYCFPSWRPIRNLSEINEYDQESQNKRISQLIAKYVKKNGLNSMDYVELNFGWASKMCFWTRGEKSGETEDIDTSVRTTEFVFGLWPSNVIGQYNALIDASSFNFFNGKQLIDYNGITICLSVVPFIKIYDNFGSQLFRINFERTAIKTKAEYEDRCKSIKGRWNKREENGWDEFFKRIESFDGLSEEGKAGFKAYLGSSNRSCFNVVLSCEIIGTIPYKTAQQIDEKDKFLEFFEAIIKELEKIIADKK